MFRSSYTGCLCNSLKISGKSRVCLDLCRKVVKYNKTLYNYKHISQNNWWWCNFSRMFRYYYSRCRPLPLKIVWNQVLAQNLSSNCSNTSHDCKHFSDNTCTILEARKMIRRLLHCYQTPYWRFSLKMGWYQGLHKSCLNRCWMNQPFTSL